jgi:hypothetical protein
MLAMSYGRQIGDATASGATHVSGGATVGAGSDFRGRGGVIRIARPPKPAEEVGNVHAFFCQDLIPFLRKVVRRFASPRSTPAPRPSRRTLSAQPTTGVTMTVSAQLWRFAPPPL